ncbi:hypothetical protein GHT06_020082 [Daphnia sinensis]|uniref:Uncharacterized protein n=1 Tax=Daphnia sinensis TaxID=1820382 RepID=A0AAD5PTP4_9CRUS|nr:hypothetical protein GHT06_020082 [Daphnia sinensis]
MFQWKPSFPQKPSPPTIEQQKEDMNKCINNLDAVKIQYMQDSECSANAETNTCFQKLGDLLVYKRNVDNNIQDLNNMFPRLINISTELQDMSDNVRLKAYQSIK